MKPTPNSIVQTVLDTFNALPAKRKPRHREDGSVEEEPTSLRCVALGTGAKCLPTSKLPLAKGIVLHDWHAEILAIRSFNLFLIQECLSLCRYPTTDSPFIRRRSAAELSETHFQPFTVKEDTQIHMYCSEAPCGDASMELTMDAQEDATPWPTPLSVDVDPSLPAADLSQPLLGRGYFSSLGIVRRKPSRPDAPPCLSKSCSDKLSLKSCTSLLSTPASLLISPEHAYLNTLILPPSQHSSTACERAFGPNGRMAALAGKTWNGGYAHRPFDIQSTELDFMYSRRAAEGRVKGQGKLIASNISAVWTPHGQETLVNGILQGRRHGDARGGSMVCRKGIWKAVGEVIAILGIPKLKEVLEGTDSYVMFKQDDELLVQRREVKAHAKKDALKGWIGHQIDDFKL